MPGLFDDNFLPGPYLKFACRVILQHSCFCSFAGEQLDRNPAFAAIRRLAPLPTRGVGVLASDIDSLTSLDAYRVGILNPVLELYATLR